MLKSLLQFNVYSVLFHNLNQIFCDFFHTFCSRTTKVSLKKTKSFFYSRRFNKHLCSLHRENAQEKKIIYKTATKCVEKNVLCLVVLPIFRIYFHSSKNNTHKINISFGVCTSEKAVVRIVS